MKTIIGTVATLVLLMTSAHAKTDINLNEFDEGIDYIELSNPVKTINSEKVEVRELFWYFCSHCYNLEPNVEKWLESKPENVDFVRHPAVFRDDWKLGANFLHILEALKKDGVADTEKLHKALFHEIHDGSYKLNSIGSFLTWLNKKGVPEKITKKYKHNFSIALKTNISKRTTRKYNFKM
jgi:thiol:disulfide interchange protein DsbA